MEKPDLSIMLWHSFQCIDTLGWALRKYIRCVVKKLQRSTRSKSRKGGRLNRTVFVDLFVVSSWMLSGSVVGVLRTDSQFIISFIISYDLHSSHVSVSSCWVSTEFVSMFNLLCCKICVVTVNVRIFEVVIWLRDYFIGLLALLSISLYLSTSFNWLP